MSGKTLLVVRIKKNLDGRTSLSCTRRDGTVTWQKMKGSQAAFFPRHDLTHLAVESVLGHRSGFYGLISDGWDLADFGSPWPRGPLPPQATLVEVIVGFFDVERATGVIATAEELNQNIAAFCSEHGMKNDLRYSDDDVARVRQRRGELFSKWDAVPAGDALEVEFAVE